MVRHGLARRGTAGEARYGLARYGGARRGMVRQARSGQAGHGESRYGWVWKMKNYVIDDELREEMRLRPDRHDRFEAILARGEILKDGSEPRNMNRGEKDDK